jgi:hypothetical protein
MDQVMTSGLPDRDLDRLISLLGVHPRATPISWRQRANGHDVEGSPQFLRFEHLSERWFRQACPAIRFRHRVRRTIASQTETQPKREDDLVVEQMPHDLFRRPFIRLRSPPDLLGGTIGGQRPNAPRKPWSRRQTTISPGFVTRSRVSLIPCSSWSV